ncbi:MAG: hypothetical protein ACT4O1_09500 [Gemmatimonadota bacterium]
MGRTQLLVSLAPALIFAACVDTAAPEITRTGLYLLSRIDGESLPAEVMRNADARLDFVRGELRLNADLTFSDITNFRIIPLSQNPAPVPLSTDSATGTYHILGDTVFFEPTRGPDYQMKFQSSGSLQQVLAGKLLLYRKRS